MTDWRRVIEGDSRWSVDVGDCREWLATLPADSVDLVMCSPPYEAARTYGVGFKLKDQAWIDWMVEIVRECVRVCKGLVCIVCEGQTRKYRYSCAPILLMADLHRAGFNLRKPAAYCRVGIPGSGGPDWLRNDYEFCVCIAGPGSLPWSDNTACGHPPKYRVGGAMSNRNSDGVRSNDQAGPIANARWNRDATSTKLQTRRKPDGSRARDGVYTKPAKANPGNLIKCKVGGGLMGHPLAHDNEAPYPLKLAAFFVQSFCPPGGITIDPFSGSGTTGHAALEHGRRYIGCDVRQSQADLTTRRLQTVTPGMFTKEIA